MVAHVVGVLRKVDRLERKPPKALSPIDGLRVRWCVCACRGGVFVRKRVGRLSQELPVRAGVLPAGRVHGCGARQGRRTSCCELAGPPEPGLAPCSRALRKLMAASTPRAPTTPFVCDYLVCGQAKRPRGHGPGPALPQQVRSSGPTSACRSHGVVGWLLRLQRHCCVNRQGSGIQDHPFARLQAGSLPVLDLDTCHAALCCAALRAKPIAPPSWPRQWSSAYFQHTAPLAHGSGSSTHQFLQLWEELVRDHIARHTNSASSAHATGTHHCAGRGVLGCTASAMRDAAALDSSICLPLAWPGRGPDRQDVAGSGATGRASSHGANTPTQQMTCRTFTPRPKGTSSSSASAEPPERVHRLVPEDSGTKSRSSWVTARRVATFKAASSDSREIAVHTFAPHLQAQA